ncbi:MAG: bL21 family ribosomal protein, partial [Paracoccaceae bacterium]
TPMVAGAAVQAEVVDQIKADKVINFVKRRRKHSSQRTKGHRQKLTLVKITDILSSGADASGIKAAVGAGSVPAAAPAAPAKKPAKAKAEKAPAPAKAPAAKKAAKPAKAEAAPAVDDDLKKLTGVGPALEKKLIAAGITSYAQIAAWTDADVAAIDEQLSFKGKIEREGWIDQAKELAK